MSTGSKLSLAEAEQIAAAWMDRLGAFVDRVGIAGIIRRRKPECGDVEICVIAPQVPSDPRFIGLTRVRRDTFCGSSLTPTSSFRTRAPWRAG